MTSETLADLAGLVGRVPEGWTAVEYGGLRYGLTRHTCVDGRTISVFAEQLGGTDVVSANVWLLDAGPQLRPCEMPAQKVVDFLRGWQPAV